MSSKREVLKCRRCQVAAHTIKVDGNIHGVECPQCGVRVEGPTFSAMYAKEIAYFQQKVRQDLLRGTMPERREPGVSVSYSFTELPKPDWEFFVAPED